MPRRKKEELVNALADADQESLQSMSGETDDDFVIGNLDAEAQNQAADFLKAMDERQKITASKAKKRGLYNDDRNATIAMDDADLEDLITDEDIRWETYQKLSASLLSGSVQKGTVFKAAVRSREEGKPGMPTAIITMDDDNYFKIKIPFTDFIPKERMSEVRGETPADKLNYMDLMINKRTYVQVYFVVKKLDEETGEVIASRTEAMAKISRSKWFERTRDNKYTINVGTPVLGIVQYVDRAAICVDALGVEKVIDVNDVSWIRYSDLRDAPLRRVASKTTRTYEEVPYKPGDPIRLMVTGIKRVFTDAEGNTYVDDEALGKRGLRPKQLGVALSVKLCEENPDKRYYNDFELGDKVSAEITYVNDRGIFCKIANKRSAFIRFNANSTALPLVGDKVIVRITGKNDENYQINCDIVWTR